MQISDQLFWIIAVLLVVEILSQLFDFETMGKIFIQFYVLIVHLLVGVTLASFETNDLIYYFVVLIVFVNGLRYLFHKLPIFDDRKGLRLALDFVMIGFLVVLMGLLDPYLSFGNVPTYSNVTQLSVLASLSMALIYEMFQRVFQTGISLDDFLPRSLPSFIVVSVSLIFGLFLTISGRLDVPIALKYQMLFGYVFVILLFRVLSFRFARDSEYYDTLYFLPSLFSMILFAQLVLFGG